MTRSAVAPELALPTAPAVVYLDNAATSPLCPAAAEAIRAGIELFGNPSSAHPAGEAALEALTRARAQVARLFGCPAEEVVFTGGGSEANAMAIVGTVLGHGDPRQAHIVTTAIEHSAVLQSACLAQDLGAEVTVVAPNAEGWIDPRTIADALRPNTVLVSVMHANNETGVVQPIAEIAALAHRAGALVHTDAVQTAGKVDLTCVDADLVSISAHKFHGPKGVGALRVAPSVRLAPLLRGGGQEAGRRAGTENTLGVLGMGAAAVQALAHLADIDYQQRRPQLRQVLLDGLAEVADMRINGIGAPGMPETVNLSFLGLRGDTIVDVLAAHGVCLSAGSACHAGESSPSHVLTAMGVPVDWARSAVRVSFGRFTTREEVAHAAALLAATVHRLRALTPTGTGTTGR
ncbi:cysteine desulfurase family protein [Actinokineospora guangxiensis]|uniref:Cysteine desulfurase family protein n=1 Tax=Actinokineospora guangxiensis TaxID=1490288 RepID=A0ABW0EQ32_9PSEU